LKWPLATLGLATRANWQHSTISILVRHPLNPNPETAKFKNNFPVSPQGNAFQRKGGEGDAKIAKIPPRFAPQESHPFIRKNAP